MAGSEGCEFDPRGGLEYKCFLFGELLFANISNSRIRPRRLNFNSQLAQFT